MDINNSVRIATICNMFCENLAINFANLYFYPSIDKIPEDRMKENVVIEKIVAMHDSNNDVIGTLVCCGISPIGTEENCPSSIWELCNIFPDGLQITLHRKSYKKVTTSGNFLEEVTSGASKDIFDFFGNEDISADIIIKANCNCGIDITYTPYKE